MIKICRKTLGILFVGVFCTILSPNAHADDVEDSVKEAMEYYKQGDYTNAAGSLDYASQLIRQKKGLQLEAVLPQPLPGWTADDASSQAMGVPMFSGGVTAERSFKKDSSNVTVQIITDSPMLQGLMMMFNNPSYVSPDGGKLEKISGQKAIVRYNGSKRNGDIQIIVDNRFLVMFQGRNVTKDDLKTYAEAINYKKLAAM